MGAGVLETSGATSTTRVGNLLSDAPEVSFFLYTAVKTMTNEHKDLTVEEIDFILSERAHPSVDYVLSSSETDALLRMARRVPELEANLAAARYDSEVLTQLVEKAESRVKELEDHIAQLGPRLSLENARRDQDRRDRYICAALQGAMAHPACAERAYALVAIEAIKHANACLAEADKEREHAAQK